MTFSRESESSSESGVWTLSSGSKKTELTVLKMSSWRRKEMVLGGWWHGHFIFGEVGVGLGLGLGYRG